VNKAQQVMGEILRIADVVVQVNPSGRKWVLLMESNVVSMSSLGRSCCFLGTAQPGMTTFVFCNLSDCIPFVGFAIETLHEAMGNFSLVKIAVRAIPKESDFETLQFA
jgi:hypothetical protein